MIFSETPFGQPHNAVWFLILIPLAVLLFFTERLRKKTTSALVSPSLWPEMFPGFSYGRRIFRLILAFLATALFLTTFLHPQWGYTLKEIKRKGVDIFILADVSRSMEAQDISPSRMERARRELKDLVQYLHGDRIGLIPFAGEAYVACPLTTDYDAFSLYVDELGSDLLSLQGTNMAAAIETALTRLGSSPERSRAIILLTDGEDTSGRIDEATKRVKESDTRFFVMGIGTPEGAPIPQEQGGFKTDLEGQMILSRLNESWLIDLAKSSQGVYVRSVSGDSDLERIYLKGIKEVLEDKELKSEQKEVGIERFQIPLAFGILLWVWEGMLPERKGTKRRRFRFFKKNKANALVFLILALMPPTLFAETAGGEIPELEEELAQNPEDPLLNYNLGVAYYANGDFEKAKDRFLAATNAEKPFIREKALYNLGDAYYRLNQFDDSLAAFDKVVLLNPENKKAALNAEFVRNKKEEKEQQEQKEQQEKEQKQEEQKEQEQKDAEQQKDGEKKDGESGEEKPEQAEEQEKGEQEKLEGAEKGDPKQGEGQDQKTPQQMSRDQANRWLESLEDRPGEAVKERVMKEGEMPSTPPEKDW